LTRFARLGKPIIVALTKVDVAGVTIDVAALARELGVSVVAVNALTGAGAQVLLTRLSAEVSTPTASAPRLAPLDLDARFHQCAPPEQVTHFPESGLYLEDPQLSRDGRQFVYSRIQTTADLWVVELQPPRL